MRDNEALGSIWFYTKSIVLPTALIVLAVNRFVPTPFADNPRKSAELAEAAGNHVLAESLYRGLIKVDSLDVELHRLHLSAHYAQPVRRGRHQTRDDSAVVRLYRRYAAGPDPAVGDIGHYGLGFGAIQQGRWAEGLDALARVQNTTLPFLNNSIGYALLRSGRPDSAEAYFLRELEVGTNVDGAVSNLARLYFERRDFKRLGELERNAAWRRFMPADVSRFFDLHRRDVSGYVRSWFRISLPRREWDGALAAFLVLGVWFVYFLLLDAFEPERLWALAFMLGLGMGFCLACTALYDLAEYGLHFRLNGRPLNDLLFCIFGIGVIEESVKVLPVLAMVRWSRQVDEPLDLIVYASVSALGFSFLENLGYFHPGGLRSIAGRAFSASMLHMGCTSVVMYGLLLARYRGTRFTAAYVAAFFTFACVLHGLYDFWLVGEGWVRELSLLSLILLVVLVQIFGTVINNGINLSPFFSESKTVRLRRLVRYLASTLSAVAVFQYLVMAFRFGPGNANQNLWRSVGVSLFMIWIIALHLGRLTVMRSRLLPLFRKLNRP